MPATSRGVVVACVALWAAVVGLLVAFPEPLWWAARALPLYVAGHFPKQRELDLVGRGTQLLRDAKTRERGVALIEQAIAIDPYTHRFQLAEAYRISGRTNEALAQYHRTLEVDPLTVEAYERISSMLARLGRTREAEAALDRGIAALEAAAPRYRAVQDPSVALAYNVKAVEAERRLVEGALELRSLRDDLRRRRERAQREGLPFTSSPR